MIKFWIDKFHKKNFDINREGISIHEYHIIMRYVFLIHGIVDGVRKRPFILSLNMLFVFITGVVGMLILCNTITYDLETGDLTEATEVAIYFIMAMLQSGAVAGFHVHKRFYRGIRDSLEREFRFISSPAGKKYRKQFFETHLLTWQLCVIWTITILGICFSFFVKCTLDLVIYYMKQEKEADKPFTLPLRLPPGLDRNATPYYQMLMLVHVFSFIAFTQIFLAHNYTLILSIGHVLAQLGMTMADIEDLFSDDDDVSRAWLYPVLKSKIKNIVNRHQNTYKYLDYLSMPYKKGFAYAQLITTPVVCLTAYNFANGLDEHKLYPLMAMLCVGGAVQYLVPCLGITIITAKLNELADACAQCEWWGRGEAGRRAARDLQIIMARSIKPLLIRVPGFKILSLEVFSQALAASYTYFNMLRQVK